MYYHLYFNAFQPGSMMDARSRSISDPDPRIGNRIVHLKADEIGYHNIKSLKSEGTKLRYTIDGTLLTVKLDKPLTPGKKIELNMEFESQIPIQIRRSGRHNFEGVDYTMTQWYPKVAEYDEDGWMTDEYIGREFHGVWGDFDVKITTPTNFIVGGTGYLQNPEEVGSGYPLNGKSYVLTQGDKKTWHFIAPKVHDFAWAADPNFKHDVRVTKDGLELHFFYLNDTSIAENWKKLQSYTEENFAIMNGTFGKYPYKQYSVIQGGDGGMEYPMCTMIVGKGSFGGLVSVMVHESIHSWYYGLLATNENKYPWMDEGFTQFAQYHILDSLFKRKQINPVLPAYKRYLQLAKSPDAEPLTTPADFYHKNSFYGINSYYKGSVFLKQLEYIIGTDVFHRGMRNYYYSWRFKHPTPTDFKKVMEKESGLNLDWYFQNFIGTTKSIDYAIINVEEDKKQTSIDLSCIGQMPMPVELQVTLKDGSEINYYIPLRSMRGTKTLTSSYKTSDPWPWTYPVYKLKVSVHKKEIEQIRLFPHQNVADVNVSNNTWSSDYKAVIFTPRPKK
jgi:hypothetical protein